MSKEIKIHCTQCATVYTVHEPEVMRVNRPGIAQVTLFSSAALDERACPNCRTVHAPVCAKIEIRWIKFEAQQRIAIPTPQDLRQLVQKPA